MPEETGPASEPETGMLEVTGPPSEAADEMAEAAAPTDAAEKVRDALREVMDPELGINIVDLGLVYDVEVQDAAATITMSLTSPGCPAGGQILSGAKNAAEGLDSIDYAEVNLVWQPFWTPERIDPKVRAALGF